MRKTEIEEGLGELADIAERDHEVQMARADLYKSAKYSIKLHEMLKGVSEAEGLEGWVQSKITKASEMLGSVYHHLDYEESGLADESMAGVTEAEDTKPCKSCKGTGKIDSKDCDHCNGSGEHAIKESACNCNCGKAICESCGKAHKVSEGDGIYHDCAKKFTHKKYGECTVIPGEHTLLENGTVTHYDATFLKDGEMFAVRNVSVEDIFDVLSEKHVHAAKSYKKKPIKKKNETKERLQTALEGKQAKMDVTDADKKGGTPAYKRMKASDKRYNDKTTKTTEGKFKSAAQRKAVHAAKASGKKK